jgi:hypothetical protein
MFMAMGGYEPGVPETGSAASKWIGSNDFTGCFRLMTRGH